jgi:hypothetical protein
MNPGQSKQIFDALETFRIELPSWGFANTGTRFGIYFNRQRPRRPRKSSAMPAKWTCSQACVRPLLYTFSGTFLKACRCTDEIKQVKRTIPQFYRCSEYHCPDLAD